MPLTPTEQKKVLKIKKEIAEKQKRLDLLIEKTCQVWIKKIKDYELWKLDQDTLETELKTIAEKHKTI